MNENEFKNKYTEQTQQKLEEAKEYRKNFQNQQYNFYDSNKVKELKDRYKNNEYISNRIDIETKTDLDPKYQTLLEKDEVKKYEDKAKELVDEALKEEKNYKKYKERPMIVIKLSDTLTIPFYKSTWKWGKLWVPKDKFYPVFGIGEDKKRLNKGHQCEINNFYSSPLLAAIAQVLNEQEKSNKITPDKRKESNDEFITRANTWKTPVNYEKSPYDNINKTLDEIAKIQETIK